jgi:hypothetical protein
MRPIRFGTIALLSILTAAANATAQIALPVKSYETLNFELESLRDDITLFRGDPQYLLQMEVRPNRFRPRVDYFDQTDATVRIRDLYAVDHPDYADQKPEARDAAGEQPLEETWEIRLSPVGPTHFALRTERGKGAYDFTDFEVSRVELRAVESKVEVGFDSQNPIELERFAARIIGGSLRFLHMINAHAKEISLDLPDAQCELELTGKEFAGESSINILGVPSGMHLRLSRKLGLRVTGPAATIAHFESETHVPLRRRLGEPGILGGEVPHPPHVRVGGREAGRRMGMRDCCLQVSRRVAISCAKLANVATSSDGSTGLAMCT